MSELMPGEEFSRVLSKEIKALKRMIGVQSVRQGYHGTGSQSHRRQLFVRLANDRMIDLWINGRTIKGGVMLNLKTINTEDQDIPRILRELSEVLQSVPPGR